ncbi:MAG: spermidine/putrescine ABC transporter substrate-binding protein PotF, partial [Polaromonas sp.]|nr:spermidine/putrescine ABC transporter substrate-binding protein PotF [Polaromonas sp.]
MKKLVLAVAMSAVLLAACGKKEEPVAAVPAPVVATPAAPVNTEEKVLNIYNWPDYVPEGMIAA